MPHGIRGSTPTCSIEDCEELAEARGWCSKHFGRWRRHGDPLAGSPARLRGRSIEEQFWAKVNKDGPLSAYRPDLGPCWEWLATSDRAGYGRFAVASRNDGQKRKSRPAHAWAYELCIGPVPEGLELDHLCRIRRCVNPYHLEPVTHEENMRRGKWGMATACIHGHPFDDANTYIARAGNRVCRSCRQISQQEYRSRKKRLAASMTRANGTHAD